MILRQIWCLIMSFQKQKLSAEQEKEVDILTKEIQPKINVFVAVMKASNVKSQHSL